MPLLPFWAGKRSMMSCLRDCNEFWEFWFWDCLFSSSTLLLVAVNWFCVWAVFFWIPLTWARIAWFWASTASLGNSIPFGCYLLLLYPYKTWGPWLFFRPVLELYTWFDPLTLAVAFGWNAIYLFPPILLDWCPEVSLATLFVLDCRPLLPLYEDTSISPYVVYSFLYFLGLTLLECL